MKISRLQQSLANLVEFEWRYEYQSSGPDEYICPGYCRQYIQNNITNQSTKNCIHDNDCPYHFVMETIKSLIEKENPNDALKEIL